MDAELALRAKFQAPLSKVHPTIRIQRLLAFWHHFALHRRKCEHSGKTIVSVFDEACPYPVWDREAWIKDANPPSAEYDFSKSFFPQLWELFQRCPIPKSIVLGNENCDYTDDWWYSKSCYLCHSGFDNENCYYCYRIYNCRDVQYSYFSDHSELSRDLVYAHNCYNVKFGLYSKNCRDSAFLYDCRNCNHCLFSWNLRNKSYCVENKQLTKEEYFKVLAQYDLDSRSRYESSRERFLERIAKHAWWKAQDIEKCQGCSGDYLESDKECLNCYFVQAAEDCVNCTRGHNLKTAIDTVSGFRSELVINSSLVQDECYDVRYSYNIFKSRFLEYCGFCYNCTDCFACWGLVGRRFCILNREYPEAEYRRLVASIREQIRAEGIEGEFFPAYFAPCPYDESLAGSYYPLSQEEQLRQGYRVNRTRRERPAGSLSASEVPDRINSVDESIFTKLFWDEKAERPFRIEKFDMEFSTKTGAPLPAEYYVARIKSLFSLVPYNGELRTTRCAHSGKEISTSLPKALDGRILSVEAYLELVA